MVGFVETRVGIEWNVVWGSDPLDDDPSLGVLTISIGDEEVWASEDGDWPWIDLLRWLGRSWAWLKAEEGPPAPLDVDARSVRGLQDSALQPSLHSTSASLSRADLALWNFRETHDLSRALNGAAAPALIIWREGMNAVVLTDNGRYAMAWVDVEEALVGIGDAIATRLTDWAASDPVAEHATQAWHERDTGDSGRWLSIARTQGQSNVVPLPPKWNDVPLGEIERSPLVAAARMTSQLSAHFADRILSLLYQLPRVQSTIDEIATAVRRRADLSKTQLPFEQAHVLAKAFREHLTMEDDEPFAPEAWLLEVGVTVRDVRLGIKDVEAFAAWGPDNGPGIIVNLNGAASSTRSGRNASLAHEICHLIIDRANALPAAEVLGGRVDTRVEQRARAFAAELLLPRDLAGVSFAHVEDEVVARRTVHSLTSRFVVSREVVAWQARNSEVSLSPEVYEYLRGLVGYPDRF